MGLMDDIEDAVVVAKTEITMVAGQFSEDEQHWWEMLDNADQALQKVLCGLAEVDKRVGLATDELNKLYGR